MQGQELGKNSQSDSWERVSQVRDKFEYDRERRMREKGWFQSVGLILCLLCGFLFFRVYYRECIELVGIHGTPIPGKELLRMN